jgi:hypothetical protein
MIFLLPLSECLVTGISHHALLQNILNAGYLVSFIITNFLENSGNLNSIS